MARDTLSISSGVLGHLKRLGLEAPAVGDELTTDAYFEFWRRLASRHDRPALGLELGTAVFGRSIAAEAALQAPTLGDALRTIGRYKRLSCPEDFIVEVRDGEASVRCDWILATGEVPPLLVDAIFASQVRLASHATGGKAAPLRIELARRSRHAALLRAHFACPIVFGRAHDRIVFAERALALPLVTANGKAYERLLPGLEAKLAGKRSLVGEVRVAIARTIGAGARPSVEAVAARLDVRPRGEVRVRGLESRGEVRVRGLESRGEVRVRGLSARTLQRRLGDAGTTFQDQLDDVRRVAARRLLTQTELGPIDIAFLLGFAEPNSFVRAFRAWERTTPLRFRAARG